MSTLILASDGGGTSMSSAVSDIFTIASQALTVVTGNPILLTFFCAGLVGIGIGVIKKLKG